METLDSSKMSNVKNEYFSSTIKRIILVAIDFYQKKEI